MIYWPARYHTCATAMYSKLLKNTGEIWDDLQALVAHAHFVSDRLIMYKL